MKKMFLACLAVAAVFGVREARAEVSASVWVDCSGSTVLAYASAYPWNGAYMTDFFVHLSGPGGEAESSGAGGYNYTTLMAQLTPEPGEYVAYTCAEAESDDGWYWDCDWAVCTVP
jgi:hypothetical protein